MLARKSDWVCKNGCTEAQQAAGHQERGGARTSETAASKLLLLVAVGPASADCDDDGMMAA